MDSVYIIGQVENFLLVFGKMENNMELVNISKENKLNIVDGKMEKKKKSF